MCISHSFLFFAGMHPLSPFKADDELTRLLEFCPIRCNETKSLNGKAVKPGKKPSDIVQQDHAEPLLEAVANHDAFISLLEVIDTARNRKRGVLSLIEDANTLMVAHLPFGDDDAAGLCLSRPAEDYISWLRTNLERTDQVLDVAMEYLRAMYGGAYLPTR
jgi:hypothetical protein